MRVSRENEDDRQNILLNRASALSSSPEVVTQTVHDKKVGWSNLLSSSRIIIKKSTWKPIHPQDYIRNIHIYR